MTEFNRELVKDWVKALRSGDYKQTSGLLTDNGSFCCLGVLCAVKMDSRNFHDILSASGGGNSTIYSEESLYKECNLGKTVVVDIKAWPYGQYMTAHDYFYRLNDAKGKTFPEIADEIERVLLND